jgi:hypothetical protein
VPIAQPAGHGSIAPVEVEVEDEEDAVALGEA